MSDSCCQPPISADASVTPGFRRALWIALVLNGAMFGVEIAGGVAGDSVALLADAVDFLGDAGNYAISLLVLSWSAAWRSRAAMIKGASMGLYGVIVLGRVGWNAVDGSAPVPLTMGAIGLLALSINVAVALMLYRFRNGEANMRSVWLCSRNDAIANVAVLLAALGVFGSGRSWPDLVVASGIALLALVSAHSVIRHAAAEMRRDRAYPEMT